MSVGFGDDGRGVLMVAVFVGLVVSVKLLFLLMGMWCWWARGVDVLVLLAGLYYLHCKDR